MSDAAIEKPAPRRKRRQAEHAFDRPHEIDWVKVFLGFGGMVIGQFMAFLDIQIVASSLPQIQSGIGATADEISWVQTIYLLAEVVIMPLTAYLTKMWGTRRFYVAAAACFIVTSIATGLSTSIEAMIVTRALQGLAAGAMIPPVFATAMTVFPPERRIMANVIVGLIVTLAPTIGPTLGGHITEALNWRWLFFINVPPGILVIFLVWRYGGFDKADPTMGKGIDWLGLALMAVFLLSGQYVLEEGSGEGWFQDGLILWLAVLSAITGVAFIWRQLTYRQPIVSLAPFRDRNFTLGVTMSFVAGMSMFGGVFVIPLFLAQVLRYSAAQVGTTMLVSGLAMFVSAPVVGRIVRLMDLRVAMVLGFGLTAWSIGTGAYINANWSFTQFAIMQAVRGLGMMLAMVAAQQLTVSTLPLNLMKDASGLVNLIRNVGGAVGLAMLSTVLSDRTAMHYSELTAAINASSAASQDMLNGLAAMMQQQGTPDPEGTARKAFSMMIRRDAAILAFADAFLLLAIGAVIAGALSVFAGKARAVVQSPAGGH